MKRIILSLLLLLLLHAASNAQTKIDISLKNGSRDEAATREQLQRLLKIYDLSKWIFTKTVSIDEKAIPHSHPVLTLSARHLKDDELLLSTFVHEQIHWFLSRNDKATAEAMKDVKALFPKVPSTFPEGADNEESTYRHLLVNYLEYRAARELLGELKAKQVMEFWAGDHYTWIYKTVLERPRDIGNIMFKHNLVPKSQDSQTKAK